MYSKDLLITDNLPPLVDKTLEALKLDILNGTVTDSLPDPYSRFIAQAQQFFTSSKRNSLIGLDQFGQIDIVMGCQHFIDSLIIKHGLDGLQIFEHDYRYYQRLLPNITYAQVGKLDPNKPVLIAAPFPGYLNLHPQWADILQECEQKQIPVHIDAAWLGSATDIHIDFSHPAISSVAMSLSKGLGMSWNRVGLRWSKQFDSTDNVCIMNKFGMLPEMLVRNGLIAINTIPIDYLWDTYESQHYDICRSLKLRPTKIIQVAHSIDRSRLYGLANLIS
jgi:hypothetical protein